MKINQIKAMFAGQFGHIRTLTFIELPKEGNMPTVATIDQWKLGALIYTHTWNQKDQEMSLPRLRRKE